MIGPRSLCGSVTRKERVSCEFVTGYEVVTIIKCIDIRGFRRKLNFFTDDEDFEHDK
jgi:hypothetical protein